MVSLTLGVLSNTNNGHLQVRHWYRVQMWALASPPTDGHFVRVSKEHTLLLRDFYFWELAQAGLRLPGILMPGFVLSWPA